VKSEIEKLKNLLSQARHIVVLTHTRPDGDAIASLLALCICLNDVGYNISGILPESIPTRYAFFPNLDQIKTDFPQDADLIIAVDCADSERLAISPNMSPPKVDVNIDHHSSNSLFGSINIVDPEAASTTQVLHQILRDLGFPIHQDVATLLLIGVVTDTIGFRTNSVTPEVLRLAASLQELGAPLAEIQQRSLHERSFDTIQYWGYGLSRISKVNEVVWTSLSQTDREKSGYTSFDDADLINILSTVEGTRVAIVLVEQPEGKIKVSWRSSSGINVSDIAEIFGGGGHKAAAGAMIEGDMDKVSRSVLETTVKAVGSRAEPEA